MLAFWPFYQIQLLTCLSDHSSRSRRTTKFLKKAGSPERTAFVHSSVQRRNKTLWVLWNCSDTWKLFYYFFYRKDKAKLCFLQQDFLAWICRIWAKWTLVSAFMFFLYTNRESQTPRGIVGKYKVQSGITTDFVCTCVCYRYRATLKQVCNLSKLGGEEFFIGFSL